jgi:hypothetical protein
MTLKLSEAIRLGAMLHPQAFGQLHSSEGTCALGAAEDAGFQLASILGKNQFYRCPVCGGFGTLPVIIELFNDWHRWTREQIADWVEQTVEQPTSSTREQLLLTEVV